MKPTFTYTGQPGQGFGWGTCNTYLQRHLARHFEPGGDVVMQPLADHDFNASSELRGTKLNFGYAFFEFPLGPNAKANAAKYDVVFVGSTWCLDRLREAGIHNGRVLIQGVDTEIFKPVDRNPSQPFTVFSGGKFEWRKGQDLVIRAFSEFLRRGYKAHLVACWFNPWPGLVSNAVLWSGLKYPKGELTQTNLYRELCTLNGILSENVTICEPMNHADTARTMGACHAGLFPNRCEGGTNLVLMEYAATGGDVIANSLTGHADVGNLIRYEIEAKEDPQTHWAEQTIDAIVGQLVLAYSFNGRFPNWINATTKPPTWQQTAQTVADTVEELWQA